MPGWGSLCDDAQVTDASRIRRRVHRSHDRVIAGVAGGWAERWQVEPTVVRACVGLLTLVGGLGLVLYGIAAAASEPPFPIATGERAQPIPRRNLAVGGGDAGDPRRGSGARAVAG